MLFCNSFSTFIIFLDFSFLFSSFLHHLHSQDLLGLFCKECWSKKLDSLFLEIINRNFMELLLKHDNMYSWNHCQSLLKNTKMWVQHVSSTNCLLIFARTYLSLIPIFYLVRREYFFLEPQVGLLLLLRQVHSEHHTAGRIKISKPRKIRLQSLSEKLREC